MHLLELQLRQYLTEIYMLISTGSDIFDGPLSHTSSQFLSKEIFNSPPGTVTFKGDLINLMAKYER